jgi:hypothetical protein
MKRRIVETVVSDAFREDAFDTALFTIDSDYRIRTSPFFDPAQPFLRETVTECAGDQLLLPPDVHLQSSFLDELNTGLSWL